MLIGSVANGLNSSGGFWAGACGRGSPAHQWHLVRFLRSSPGTPRGLRLRGYQHLAKHAVDPEHAAGERSRDPPRARPRRDAHDPLTRGLADLPPPAAFCDAVRICCRTLWTRRSRREFRSHGRVGCAGRSLSRCGRVSASPSQLRCRRRSVSGALASSRLPSRSCSRSRNECTCYPRAPIWSSPIPISLPYLSYSPYMHSPTFG